MDKWVECSPIVWETWVKFQVASHQRLLKWYLIQPCLTLSNIRCISRNPGKGFSPSPTTWYCSYWKGSLLVALDYGRQHYFLRQRFNIIQTHMANKKWNLLISPNEIGNREKNVKVYNGKKNNFMLSLEEKWCTLKQTENKLLNKMLTDISNSIKQISLMVFSTELIPKFILFSLSCLKL